jgi:peptidoglycan/LPS O-acetylase OafA/YrhL
VPTSEPVRLSTLRWFIVVAALSLLVASLIHFGFLISGYEDEGAALPEAVIGSVMLVGLVLSWSAPPWGRRAAVAALAFGLAGSLLGLVLVIAGIGPTTTPDVVYHVSLVTTLIVGLALALRGSRRAAD